MFTIHVIKRKRANNNEKEIYKQKLHIRRYVHFNPATLILFPLIKRGNNPLH